MYVPGFRDPPLPPIGKGLKIRAPRPLMHPCLHKISSFGLTGCFSTKTTSLRSKQPVETGCFQFLHIRTTCTFLII